jgi:ribosomal protein S18 acetylase RimI-like enzyme
MLSAMVKLVPMTGAEFAEYLDTAVELYAQAHIKAGDCDASEALELAQADYAALLPEGLDTRDQYLYSIFDEASDARVGLVWLAVRGGGGRKSAYIYDFVIREEHRAKGYGAQTLAKVDRTVQTMGATSIGLNVMGHNHAARALYEKHGYEITGIGMMKRLR